ncbi:hypothetical protein [Deinococcus yavapaiensis]|uniref:Uncharacterized protein n=1 Tax=Deinococcus yavapaiensis KR-236 TaxID=694435 RepID=A0A318S8U0_9DEIO|nr:hypothetical protein [Deinococcus yavapaiensis]PYE52826.1 hypothetical protein DES52_112148 [Deinococcus yavapaiensis KR-236]
MTREAGPVNADIVVRVRALPKLREPRGDRFDASTGVGKDVSQALAAARLAHDVTLGGVLGLDENAIVVIAKASGEHDPYGVVSPADATRVTSADHGEARDLVVQGGHGTKVAERLCAHTAIVTLGVPGRAAGTFSGVLGPRRLRFGRSPRLHEWRRAGGHAHPR